MGENMLLPNLPGIPGLTLRRFRGETDFPFMAALFSSCKVVDGVERTTGVDDLARHYRHLENCEPHTDMLFAEVEGLLVAYGRIWWEELLDGTRLYRLAGQLHPDWRGRGLGTTMWQAAELRAAGIASAHPNTAPKFLQVEAYDTEKDLVALLQRRGYAPVRYEASMLRNLDEPFPSAPMPSGLEVRPVEHCQLRPIFEAANEAFRDHWASRDQSEEDYQQWKESPVFNPQLWKIAWAGDQVAGAVHNFIDPKENGEYHRQRGYTEGICTRRPWRKLGLARSLLVQSMQMFKEMGMTETALTVDAENLSGAMHLYESVGYRQVKLQVNYRKPLGVK